MGCALFSIALTVVGPAGSRADVVYLSDGSTHYGLVIDQDSTRVVLEQRQPDGTTARRTWDREQVLTVVRTIDRDRLAALHPDDPGGYREYAEELAVQRRDPEARQLAVRLYWIAAWHGEESLRRSALLALVDLVQTDAERHGLTMTALRLDPEWAAARGWPEAASGGSLAPPAAASGDVLDLVRLIRTGQQREVLNRIQQPPVQQAARGLGLLPFTELHQIAMATQLDHEQMGKLVELEWLLSDASSGQRPDGPRSGARDSLIFTLRPRAAFDPALSLARLKQPFEELGFDPRASIWRDGQWHWPD